MKTVITNKFNILFRSFCAFQLLLSLQSFAETYSCDLASISKNKTAPNLVKKDALNFQQKFSQLYTQQEAAIKRFSSIKKISMDDARLKFFESAEGKSSFSKLAQTKKDFGYSSVSFYLFDSLDLNSSPEFYTGTVKQGPKTYFFSGQQIIAISEDLPNENVLLTRLDKNCQTKEIVHLKSKSEATDDLISYQINKTSCRESAKGLRDLSEEKQNATKSFFSKPEDQQELRAWRSEIMSHCNSSLATDSQQEKTPQKSSVTR